jgi:hypothetical protein
MVYADRRDTLLRRLTFPALQIGPGSALKTRWRMGPRGTRRVPLVAPHRRQSPRGPLVVDLPNAVEQVRRSEIHSVLVRARGVSLEDFLGGMASGTRRLTASCHHTSGYAGSDLPKPTPTCLTQDDHRLSSLSPPRPPIMGFFVYAKRCLAYVSSISGPN